MMLFVQPPRRRVLGISMSVHIETPNGAESLEDGGEDEEGEEY